MNSCPKCGTPSAGGESCPRCGVIFAKLRAAPDAPPPPAPPPPSSQRAVALFVLGAVGLAIAGFIAFIAIGIVQRRAERAAAAEVSDDAEAGEASAGDEALDDGEGGGDGEGEEEVAAAAPATERLAAAPMGGGSYPLPKLQAKRRVDSWPSELQRGGVSSSWYEGGSGHDDGRREHLDRNAPMLVYFRADWCGQCKKFDQNVLATSDSDELLRDVVKVRIDGESPDGRPLASRYGVRGYPSVFLVFDPGLSPVKIPFSTDSPAKFRKSFESGVAGAVSSKLQGARQRRDAGDLPGAVAMINAAAALDPRSTHVLWDRAWTFYDGGAFEEALRDLERARELGGSDPNALDLEGTIALELGRDADAERTFTLLVEKQPGYRQGMGFYLRGGARHRLGDVDGAREDAKAACERGTRPACGVAQALASR